MEPIQDSCEIAGTRATESKRTGLSGPHYLAGGSTYSHNFTDSHSFAAGRGPHKVQQCDAHDNSNNKAPRPPPTPHPLARMLCSWRFSEEDAAIVRLLQLLASRRT
jgi:hypothetical protein